MSIETDIEELCMAEQAAVRLEIIDGIPVWEAMPSLEHQEAIDIIRQKIKKISDHACECFHATDVTIRFPNKSIKRPDISIWCNKPAATKRALTHLPNAVIEVVSETYEYKDYVLNPPFYLKNGVADVLIYDPAEQITLYWNQAGQQGSFPRNTTFKLVCGCTVEI